MSELAGRVGLRKPAAGLGGMVFRLDMRYRAGSRRREFAETGGCLICGAGNAGLVGINVRFLEPGDCMWDPRKRMGNWLNLWGSAQAYGDCGSRGNVWENGSGICGKPCGCVKTADMEGAACVWGPPACMGNGKPMKIRNMVVECDLWTLCFWQYRGAAPEYGGLSAVRVA